MALLLPLYLVLLAGYVADARAQRDVEITNAVALAQLTASVVEGFRSDLEGTLLATTLGLGDRFRPLDQASVGPYLDRLVAEYPSLRALFLTDPRGRVIAAQANAGIGTDVSSRPYLQALLAGAEVVWTGGLAGTQSGQATVVHARAVRTADGVVGGYLAAAFQPRAFVERLPVTLAPDAQIVLLDERGQVLFASEGSTLNSLDDLSTLPLVRQALRGSIVRIRGDAIPRDAEPQYGALVPVGRSGWVMGYTRPLGMFEASLRQRLAQQAVATTLVLLLATAVTGYLTRRLLRPLGALVDAAGAVARGERAHVGALAGDADIQALATAMDSMSRAVTEREDALRDEARVVDTLRQIGETLAAELDLEKLVQAATDAATDVSGAEMGAFFYNVHDERGESMTLYTLSGVRQSAFERFPMPRNTAVFGPTFRGEGVVRLDDVTSDSRYGHNPPYAGMPEGHPPVRSYLAVSVTSRSGEVLGGLFFGHSEAGIFSERAERLVKGIAAQAAIALDNARLYREAQDAVRLRDEFLSIASHELRTPLAAIKGTAQVALRAHARGKLDDERVGRSLNTIARATERGARLAADLLDVARLRSGRMPMERQPLDLAGLLRDLASSYRDQWEGQRGLVFTDDANPAPPVEVLGDRDRLSQVFSNLLDNAAKYSPEGSPVEVSLRADADGVLVSVSDKGIGFSGASSGSDALFEPFGRAANAVSQHIQGLGLGLYISRQIVEAHDGRIVATSEGEGQGATFSVWLPTVKARQEAVLVA